MGTDLSPIVGTLGTILLDAPNHPFGYALYLPFHEVWQLSTRCALIKPEGVDADPDGPPALATASGFEYALDGGTLKEIFENLELQVGTVTEAGLLEAFLFYYDNDAFIVLERS